MGDNGSPWAVHLRAARNALAERNVRAAVRAWDDAHLAAVGSARWEGLIEVGDIALRIGGTDGRRGDAEATARKAYFAALFRARQRDSLEGVLRTAQAFAELGDGQVVEECLGLAELMAADRGDAEGRVRAVAARLASPAMLADRDRALTGAVAS